MKRFFDPRNKSFSKMTALFGVLLFFVFGLFFASHVVLAADPAVALQTVGTAGDLSQKSLPLLIASIIRVVLGVLGIVTVILIIYAGFMYMSAKGDPAKVDKAKKIITQTVIGLIIIMSSYSIASFIIGKLLEAMNGPGTITSITKKYVEPLAGSLGAGIVESHYPMRGAVDVPRNTKIFVTFKQEIDPASIIDGWVTNCTPLVSDPQSTPLCRNLKTNAVQIYETNKNPATAGVILATDKVIAKVSDDHKTFVFQMVDYLGSPTENVNYTVSLKNTIKKAGGTAAFVGANSSGYGWNFTLSKTIDTTPPSIVSVIPYAPSGGTITNKLDRNITVEITFSEPMDPIASTGMNLPYYCASATETTSSKRECTGPSDTACPTGESCKTNTKPLFENIATSAGTNVVHGRYDISNGYTTVDFTTASWCGKDPCGGDIYCLPGDSSITVDAKAAEIDEANAPQGLMSGINYNGLVDAAGNSLDGNGDGKACGSAADTIACTGSPVPANDDYIWHFSTTNNVNVNPPKVESLDPGAATGSSNFVAGTGVGNIDVSAPITLKFDSLLKASTINSTNVALLPKSSDATKTAPDYSLWYTTSKTDVPPEGSDEDAAPTNTILSIGHPLLIAAADGGHDYWSMVNQDLKSTYQICMYPAQGTAAGVAQGCNGSSPYCCNGVQMTQSAFETSCPLPTHCSDGSWIEKGATCPVSP